MTNHAHRSSGTSFRVAGVRTLVEPSPEIPLVDFAFAICSGSRTDPPGKEGAMRLLGRTLRMGPRGMSRSTFEQMIARLGGRLSVQVSRETIRVHGSVIRKHAEAFLELLTKMIREPSLRPGDIAFAKRETLANWVHQQDDDRALALRVFTRTLFGSHAYGRSIGGTPRSIRAIGRADLRALHRQCFVASNVVFGCAGDMSTEELRVIASRSFAGWPRGTPPRPRLVAPRALRGRHLRIIDKPDRLQTQLYMGTLGTWMRDKHRLPLVLSDIAFGGMFSSRLMQAVRAERGWSYGASSQLSQGRTRDAWWMWTHPQAPDTAACAQLQLELLEDWATSGINGAELEAARNYVLHGHCFDVDTAVKRLDGRMEIAVSQLPAEHDKQELRAIRKVRVRDAREATSARISPAHLVIVAVAEADRIAAQLEQLPELDSFQIVSWEDAFRIN